MVDRGTHKKRARVKADAAKTMADIDDLLAGGSGRAGVADINKIFPTTLEDEADYDWAEDELTEKYGSSAYVSPSDVADRMRLHDRTSDIASDYSYRRKRADLVDVNDRRSRLRNTGDTSDPSVGREMASLDREAEQLASRVDDLYRQTHRQTGAQSRPSGYDMAMIVDLDQRDAAYEHARTGDIKENLGFSPLYTDTGRNRKTLMYQQKELGIDTRPPKGYGADVSGELH